MSCGEIGFVDFGYGGFEMATSKQVFEVKQSGIHVTVLEDISPTHTMSSLSRNRYSNTTCRSVMRRSSPRCPTYHDLRSTYQDDLIFPPPGYRLQRACPAWPASPLLHISIHPGLPCPIHITIPISTAWAQQTLHKHPISS